MEFFTIPMSLREGSGDQIFEVCNCFILPMRSDHFQEDRQVWMIPTYHPPEYLPGVQPILYQGDALPKSSPPLTFRGAVVPAQDTTRYQDGTSRVNVRVQW